MMRDAGANTPEENRADSKRLDRLFNGLWSHLASPSARFKGGARRWSWPHFRCDYVVATADIRIALSEGKLGILPAVIGPTSTDGLVQPPSVVWPCKPVEYEARKRSALDSLKPWSTVPKRWTLLLTPWSQKS